MESEKSGAPSDVPPQPQVNPPPYSSPPVVVQPPQPAGGVAFVAPTTTIIVQAPVLGSEPSSLTCRSCNTNIVTRTEQKVTTRTHLLALAMCAVGLWCCVCLPYCMATCQTIDHFCPNCNAYIGSNRN